MKIRKEDIPVTMQAPGTIMRALKGFGGLTVAFNEVPAGTDFSPLLQGLENDLCHCPHWGYIVEGSLKIIYDNGEEEIIKAGDVFYMPPGHTGVVLEDVKMIDFNPEKEFEEVMNHIEKVMALMG